MPRRLIILLITLTLAILATPLAGTAPTKIPRVGILRHDTPPSQFIDDLRQGLHELGYVEGQNLVLEIRWAKRQLERPAVHRA